MIENKIKNLRKIISFIDIRILRLISSKDEFEDDKISTLSDVKLSYKEELNSLIKFEQIQKMFDDKEYKKSHGKNN
jgi:hypothetical protein